MSLPSQPSRWACVIGQPIAHSLSPVMHNAAFRAIEFDAHYVAREVAPSEVAEVVASFRAADCLGANVTAPHKLAVMEHLDELTDEARLLGAVNTIVNQGGRLTGDNTDARGLQRALSEAGVDFRGGRTLVLGAGGASRATILALARGGAISILVANRDPQRAQNLVDELQSAVPPNVELGAMALTDVASPAPDSMSLVVNATSLSHLGLSPDIHASWFSPAAWAVDLAYNPPVTPFMRAVEPLGIRSENGLAMLVHQAALAFEQWVGSAPAPDIFATAAKAALAARAAHAPVGSGA